MTIPCRCESGERRRYSLNEFIMDAIEEKLERDRRKKPWPTQSQ